MELFLNISEDSIVVELFAVYTNLVNTKKINPIHLSASAMQLFNENKLFNQKKLPFLITKESDIFASPLSICLYLSEISFTKQILFGNKEQEQQILSFFELVTQSKNIDRVTTAINEELEDKTFLLGHHITAADIVVFVYLIKTMNQLSDEEKWKKCHLFRWFNHIQNLSGIKEFMQDKEIPFCQFPQPIQINKKDLKKEKKDQLENQELSEEIKKKIQENRERKEKQKDHKKTDEKQPNEEKNQTKPENKPADKNEATNKTQ